MSEVDLDGLLEEYTQLVPQLQESPYTRSLHLEHIRITSALGLADELDQARSLLANYFPLPARASICDRS